MGTHEGEASTTVRVNAPPSGGSLAVVAPVPSPREFVHRFTVSASGWVDADGRAWQKLLRIMKKTSSILSS